MRSNRENLDAFDTVFVNIRALYKVELEKNNPSSKEYSVKTIKNNDDKTKELSNEVNAILKNNENSAITHSARIGEIADEMKALSQELEETGKVITNQYEGYMTIKFYAHDELVKEFTVKNDEYMDDVADFIGKPYEKHLYK